MIVGIDPGVKACGAGVVNSLNRLTGARLVRALTPEDLAVGVLDYVTLHRAACEMHEPLRVIIEYPQAYRPGQQEGDQNDLIRVALVAGACAGAIKSRFAYASVEFLLPRAWKGTTDPDVFTQRIAGRLDLQETELIEKCPASLLHNVLDGIGLALHGAGRMARRRIYE